MLVRITHIDTACFLLEIGALRILTDPVFDPPGRIYSFGFGTFSRKYSTPALRPEELGPIDLVLLSHDQHEDNLDREGRNFLKQVPLVISTLPAARRIPGIAGLREWEYLQKDFLRITAVPAQHTAWRILNPVAGKVIGFVLEWPGQNGVFYISGDTVYFKGIDMIAERYPNIDTAVLHTGRAGFPYLTGLCTTRSTHGMPFVPSTNSNRGGLCRSTAAAGGISARTKWMRAPYTSMPVSAAG